MAFSHIKSLTYAEISNNTTKSLNLFLYDDLDILDNVVYKIDIIKDKKIEVVKTIKLSKEICGIKSNEGSNFPEKGILLELPHGDYKIIKKRGAIINGTNINDSIFSSKGRVILDSEQINNGEIFIKNFNQFKFSVSKDDKFCIWIENENLESLSGEVELDIIKISRSTYNSIDKLVDSKLFTKSSIDLTELTFEKDFDNLIEFYKLEENEILSPVFKYPEGTYNITLNTKLDESAYLDKLENIKDQDQHSFNLSFGKLISLHNINIPSNVDPINYYVMVGKLEYLIYINFLTDTLYFQPCTVAECFMALHVPQSKCETVAGGGENDTYVTFKVTSYQLISNNYKNIDEIITNMGKWVELPAEKINKDEHELFYWANIENNDIEFFYRDAKRFINIENYFVYLKIDINGKIYDNVTFPINNEINHNFLNDFTGLGFLIEECNYKKVNSSDEINHVNWQHDTKWSNYLNRKNILMSNISGTGIFKISYKRFKNITNIDLHGSDNGTITSDQIFKIGINEPDVKPYNRFQYWLRTEKF